MFTSFRKCEICHLHISHNTPYLPPKILHKLCFSFLLSITAVPREIENRAYAKFFFGGGGGGGENLVDYGRCASGILGSFMRKWQCCTTIAKKFTKKQDACAKFFC